MVKPPIKKPITATRDERLNILKPMIAWPEVQPPAYRVPKPTKKPPTHHTNKLTGEVQLDQLNSSPGSRLVVSCIPYLCKVESVLSEIAGALSFGRKFDTIKAPIMMPRIKNIAQLLDFQSYLKKRIEVLGMHIAQKSLSVLEIPNDLLVNTSSIGTVNPIIGPATYHGHGCEIKFISTNLKDIWTKIIKVYDKYHKFLLSDLSCIV